MITNLNNKLMAQNTTTLKQFKTFCKKNNPRNFDEAILYFTIFGGLDIPIDTTIPIDILIEKLILNKYKIIRNDINNLTNGDNLYHLILTSLALGDRRTNSAFKRAKISFDEGIDIVDNLCDLKIIKIEKSLQSLSTMEDKYTVSEKLLFSSPFVRFWFAFISPIFKGIRDKNYKEFFTNFNNKKDDFSHLIFEQISHEILKENIKDDTLIKLGRYWDDDINIDLLAKTKSGKIIAGVCKYTKSKIKKDELSKLKQKCKNVKIDVDLFVMFSNKGYTTQLKSLKSENLKLFTLKNFKF
jgi:hypothetical protein